MMIAWFKLHRNFWQNMQLLGAVASVNGLKAKRGFNIGWIRAMRPLLEAGMILTRVLVLLGVRPYLTVACWNHR